MNIDTNTGILGLIGYPLGHSISPLIHNYSLKKMNLNYVYLAFELKPDIFYKGIEGLKALNIKGFNITIPYKKKILSHLDQVDQIADNIGAVNTVVNNDGKLKGYNTDAYGFKKMLEKDGDFSIQGKKALIVGAGGASRSAGTVLCESGIKELYILNRTRDKAENLAQIWKEKYPDVFIKSEELNIDFYKPLMKKIDLLIDTTPVGMEPEVDVKPVIDRDCFHSSMLVVDLVYNPPQTTILKAAKKSGARTLNGMPMLLYQAAEAFKLWLGKEPNIEEWYQIIARKKITPTD